MTDCQNTATTIERERETALAKRYTTWWGHDNPDHKPNKDLTFVLYPIRDGKVDFDLDTYYIEFETPEAQAASNRIGQTLQLFRNLNEEHPGVFFLPFPLRDPEFPEEDPKDKDEYAITDSCEDEE